MGKDQTLKAAVKAILDDLDPEGLLELGAPKDEYEPEATDFAERLASGEYITPETVKRVWVEWFYPECGLVRQALASVLANRLNALG